MSWTHSSKAVALGVLLAVALATAGTVGAIEIAGFDDAPESAQVGEEVTVEVELTELYGDEVPDDDWNLSGQTELENADWTVIVRDAGGAEVAREDVSNSSSVTQLIDREANHVSIDVSVTGTVPTIENFNYDDRSVEEIVAMDLAQETDSGRATLPNGTYSIHRFNEMSQQARQAIDEAVEAVEESDSGQSDIEDAKTFYNNGEFESAINSAEDAEGSAEGAEQTRQFLLIGGAAVVVLLMIGVGIYYYRQSQQDTSKLQ